MPNIGSLGTLVFEVSAERTLTFEQVQQTSTYVYADHETVHGKPSSEYTGPGLKEIDLDMTFNANLGVNPTEIVETLEDMAGTGKAHALLFGDVVCGFYTIRDIGAASTEFLGGKPVVTRVQVSLAEYDDHYAGPGVEAMLRDEATRAITGHGGPDKVPGAKEALQDRMVLLDGDTYA